MRSFLSTRRHAPRRRGFTLAEVAVTIVIVGIGLMLVIQALNTAKITAAQTRNLKLSRGLATLLLGRIESGLFRDEIDSESGLQGNFSEEGWPDFEYEIVMGDDTFAEPDKPGAAFDSWKKKDELKKEKQTQEEKDAEEKAEQPYEKVKVRVSFPQIQEYSHQITLERWLPWKQVHPEKDEATGKPKAASS